MPQWEKCEEKIGKISALGQLELLSTTVYAYCCTNRYTLVWLCSSTLVYKYTPQVPLVFIAYQVQLVRYCCCTPVYQVYQPVRTMSIAVFCCVLVYLVILLILRHCCPTFRAGRWALAQYCYVLFLIRILYGVRRTMRYACLLRKAK